MFKHKIQIYEFVNEYSIKYDFFFNILNFLHSCLKSGRKIYFQLSNALNTTFNVIAQHVEQRYFLSNK